MHIDWATWPEVPKALQPKKLFVSCVLAEPEEQLLRELGWDPQDVRLLETDTVQKRANAILAWLEGVRLGSIEPSNSVAKFVELEMRACGLHTGNVEPEKPSKSSKEDIESLLNFGRKEGEQ